VSLATTERRRFVQMLVEALEKQNEEVSRARRQVGA
jgi:hypothetical protein